MVTVKVTATGLKEAKAATGKAKTAAPLRLKIGSKKAADLIARTARGRMPTGIGRKGHVKSTVKVSSVGGQPGVIAGDKSHPYMAWLDFGGRVGPKRRTHRPYLKGGRYVWKAYADKSEEVERIIDDELVELGRDMGWDVID